LKEFEKETLKDEEEKEVMRIFFILMCLLGHVPGLLYCNLYCKVASR